MICRVANSLKIQTRKLGITSGLKLQFLEALDGAAEAAPFPSGDGFMRWLLVSRRG